MDACQKMILDECVAKLGEHFESVLVLAAYKEGTEGNSAMASRIRGGFFGAKGMAYEFIEQQKAYLIGLETKPEESE